MDLLFLGTGAGVPAKHRNVTSLALNLLGERGVTWLFDCGEATQHQVLHTSIRPRRIEKIFITHLHGDHIFGLPGFLGSRSFQGGETPLTIYGPKGIKEFVDISMRVSETHLRYPIHFVEVEDGIIFEDEQFVVEARLLEHGVSSYGYRIIEKDTKGTLLVEKLREIGIKPGPIYRDIKEKEEVVLEDGCVLKSADYIGPSKKGRIVTILGDTRPCTNALKLAKGADVLVHEATFSEEDDRLAHEYYHSTSFGAAETAKKAGVKKLILTHISSRYHKEEALVLLEEAKKTFENTEMAFDFSQFMIDNEGH
ncbi:ribonuclease Z [Priestia endophytica]